jgi:hypothetical protein
MGHDRQFYEPEGGEALDSDNNIFDVTEWRKGMKQVRNGQEHVRVYNPDLVALLKELLVEQKITNTYLALIWGEEIKEEDTSS